MSEKPLHEQTVAEREAAAHAAIAAASKTPEQIAAERAAAAEQARKDDEARAEAVKQERLAQERKAWQETKFFEANPDFCINDGTPENQKGKLNGRVLGAAMTAKNLPWTAENLTATFKELQASGNLLPHAVRPPAPPPAHRLSNGRVEEGVAKVLGGRGMRRIIIRGVIGSGFWAILEGVVLVLLRKRMEMGMCGWANWTLSMRCCRMM